MRVQRKLFIIRAAPAPRSADTCVSEGQDFVVVLSPSFVTVFPERRAAAPTRIATITRATPMATSASCAPPASTTLVSGLSISSGIRASKRRVYAYSHEEG